MQTSLKTDYAIHSLMLLAKTGKAISVTDLAEKQNISRTYLAKVMQKLSNAGIVKSSEGKAGGYQLSKPPAEIKLSEIVKITEDGINIFECVDDKRNCEIKDNCKIHYVFKKSYQSMLKELEKTSIKDIINPKIKGEIINGMDKNDWRRQS